MWKKLILLGDTISEKTLLLVYVRPTHMTCPSCKLISEAVTMTARQLALEVQIQCHGLRDGGHSMAEYHDPVFMFYML